MYNRLKEKERSRKIKNYLGSIIGHSSVVCQIRLISNQKLVHIFTCIAVNFIQPLLNIIEAFLISYVINNLPKITIQMVEKSCQ